MQQFQDRLPVNRDRKFCYDIVFRKDFDTLFEESCRITPDFAAGASAATSASGKVSAGKTPEAILVMTKRMPFRIQRS